MRLIDADALKSSIVKNLGISERKYLLPAENAIWRVINCTPTIDAVPVVRCRECKYYFGDGCGECEMVSARLAAYQRDVRWNDGFYCAYGERKDGDRDG